MLRRLGRDGFLALSIAFLALRLFQVPPWDQSVDAYAYWSTRDGVLYEGATAGTIGSYLYSPAFALVLRPLTILPWPIFVTIWTAFNLAALWWLLREWSLPAMLFLPIPFEIVSGNVHLLYAVAVVAGFRWAGTWALPLLTKVTPGIGVLWFAARREWRSLALAAGVTALIAGISFLVSAADWRTWADVLRSSSSTPVTQGWYLPVPLLVRLPIAALVVLVAARRDLRWAVPIAVVLAMPVLWLNSLAVLAACVPLWRLGVRAPATAPTRPVALSKGAS
jgi:hypothetical protein